MPLAEHKLLLCTVLQRPFAAPPLHYPAETVGGLTGIFILQHCQQRRWHKRWSRLQPANTCCPLLLQEDLCVEITGKNGNRYSYKNAAPEDVIFTPDILPVSAAFLDNAGADRGTGGRISAEVYRQSLTLLVKKNRGKPDSKGKPEQQDNAAV